MKKFLRDTYIVAKHDVLVTLRNLFWIVFGLFQPVVYLLLFSPFLSGVVATQGLPGASAIAFFAPGLLIMSAIFNGSSVGFGLIDRLQAGVLERIRVTPISRLALACGIVLNDAFCILIQSVVLLPVAILLGLRPSIIGTCVTMLLILLIGIMLIAASHAVALTVKEADGFFAFTNFFTMPLVLLSGIMLPLSFAPRVIQILAACNPFSYAVTAARSLMMGNFADPAIWQAFGICAILGTLTLAWFTHKMREAVA